MHGLAFTYSVHVGVFVYAYTPLLIVLPLLINVPRPQTGSSLFVPISDHAHPIVMSKWREEPLELPPLEPPLPEVQAPYYLGLCNRRPRPGYPPPPPPKTDHRSFEVYSPLYSNKPKTFSSTSRRLVIDIYNVHTALNNCLFEAKHLFVINLVVLNKIHYILCTCISIATQCT